MTDFGVEYSDLRDMQRWGRLYAKYNDSTALFEAAEYVAIAQPDEYSSLIYSWEEGVRNNCANMHHYNRCMRDLNSSAVILKTALKKD